jgi:hypothetical protein
MRRLKVESGSYSMKKWNGRWRMMEWKRKMMEDGWLMESFLGSIVLSNVGGIEGGARPVGDVTVYIKVVVHIP